MVTTEERNEGVILIDGRYTKSEPFGPLFASFPLTMIGMIFQTEVLLVPQ